MLPEQFCSSGCGKWVAAVGAVVETMLLLAGMTGMAQIADQPFSTGDYLPAMLAVPIAMRFMNADTDRPMLDSDLGFLPSVDKCQD